MIPLTVDETGRKLLDQAAELAEVRDSAGKVIGFFVPANLYKVRLFAEASRNTDYVKLFQGEYVTQTVHTTRQVFERLKSLTEDETERADLQEKIDRFKDEDKDFLSRM
jgi:hypothetical protein